MRFIHDASISLWLRDFIPDPDRFDWDEGNEAKNAKHGVSCQEIEELFASDKYVFVGKVLEPAHSEWRGLILGQTGAGRRLALVFTRRGDKVRPISCRSMRDSERRRYEASLKEYS